MDFSKLSSDEEHALLYQHIGVAITTWSMVESGLCSVLCLCLWPTASYPASTEQNHGGGFSIGAYNPGSAIFHATESFRAKLSIVGAALYQVTDHLDDGERLRTQWDAIKSKCERINKNSRNKIAHWQVFGLSDRPGQRFALVPPATRPDFHDLLESPANKIYLSDLIQKTESFRAMAFQISQLNWALAAHPDLRDRLMQPTANVLRVLARHDPDGLARAQKVLSKAEASGAK